jgi:hypothetical protein
MGGVGAVPGALIGAGTGGAFGVAEQYMNAHGGLISGAIGSPGGSSIDPGGSYTSPGKTGKPAQEKVSVQPVPNTNLTVNLDGQAIAKSVIEWITKMGMFQTDTPASNGAPFFGP